MPDNKPSSKTWTIRILMLIILIQLWNYYRDEKHTIPNHKALTKELVEDTKPIYEFSLTECLGKELSKPATFTVDPTSTNWLLDFNNGTSLTYTIVSGNQYNPLCGLKAEDSYGDKCDICIKKDSDERATIIFKYSEKELIYSGHYMK